MRVLLGVTGGIAAYKVATVLRRLKEDGHDVRVVPTPNSLNFVGTATWEALSGHPAPSETFQNVSGIEHTRLGKDADIVLVAPATADFLARLAHGDAPHLLANVLLATSAPVVLAPAMHTEMWMNAATQANVATLKSRGVVIIEPAVGRLAGKDSGPGRLPEPEELVAALYAVARGEGLPEVAGSSRSWGDLEGLRVVISAGGTREPIDPVRFLGNRSTGHQGFALAEAARERGATVTVVAANVHLPLGEGVERIDVESGAQMAQAMHQAAAQGDVLIMAAAVADFRPVAVAAHKIKKDDHGGLTLQLEQTEDILAGLVAARQSGQTIVGFAAETGDVAATVEEHGAEKARRKGADLLVVNPVGEGIGFGNVSNRVTILDATGAVLGQAEGSKSRVAHAILDLVISSRGGQDQRKQGRVGGWVGGSE